MSYHQSSKQSRLEGSYLVASCRNCAGTHQTARIDLDAYVGNENGLFEWEGVNWSKSARDGRIEEEDGAIWLRASLRTRNNSLRAARINLSERIANIDGKLRYVEKKQPKEEQSREFLSEERDFLSSIISDTISDLHDLFTGAPLFPTTESRREQQAGRNPREGATASDLSESLSSSSDMVQSTASIRTSMPEKQEPLIDMLREEPPAYNEKSESIAPEDREAEEHETMVMRKIRDHLLCGNGNSVQSYKTEGHGRKFVLTKANGETETLDIHDRTLFNQDDHIVDSASEVSDLGRYQARCMTPSVVDGEEEWDFLRGY